MMKKTFLAFLACICMSVLFMGCPPEKPVTVREDLEAPQIFMSSPAVLPEGQYTYVQNLESIPVDIRFEDDFELDNYVVRIFRRTDLNFSNKVASDDWEEVYFGDLTGTVASANFNSNVDLDPKAGPYEFEVTVTDASGKSTMLSTYLFVSNDKDEVLPMISFVSPDTNVVDSFPIGSDVTLQANISDFGTLSSVYARIRDAFTNEIIGGSEITVDSIFAFTYQLDTMINLPAGTVPGNYKVEIYANDVTGNYGYNLDSIYVKPN